MVEVVPIKTQKTAKADKDLILVWVSGIVDLKYGNLTYWHRTLSSFPPLTENDG
jgi:hypothetical protein